MERRYFICNWRGIYIGFFFENIASGIGEALSTTIVGLAIAIPALVAFSYFSRRVERLAVEMESLLTDLIEKIFQGARRPESYARDDEPLEEAAR